MGSSGVMTDSYIGGIGSASFIPQDTNSSRTRESIDHQQRKQQQQQQQPNQTNTNEGATGDERDKRKESKNVRASAAWGHDPEKPFNQTDEDKIIKLTCTDPAKSAKSTNINKTEEYNVGYTGLSILPWEEFAFNPRVFNDMFYTETNQKITYDPEEVNTFFHGKNVMPPTVGDISENGKSWNVIVETMSDLRNVRTLLTEKCSIFGVTLVYKEKRFAKAERAPCLLMMDPSKGTIGDKLYTALTKAMDTLHSRRQFCVEINLNGCVERWCRRVLLTECKAVGAKLVITNGEEYTKLDGAEDVVCCVVCLPIWALQTGIYKLHRSVVYDDYLVEFDADDLFLHGAFQDAHCQRQQIFSTTETGPIFRTRSVAQTDVKTLQELGSLKFVCVKKYNKNTSDDADDECIDKIVEHNTTPFSELVMKRKGKVLTKEQKIKNKNKSKFSTKDGDLSDSSTTARKSIRFDAEETDNNELLDSTTGVASSRTIFSRNESFTNKAFQSSEHDIDAEITPRIPEVSSVLCDNDEESEETEKKKLNTVNGCGSLFSPRNENKNTTSIRGMSVDFTLQESNTYENIENGVSNFKALDTDTSDSESEQDDLLNSDKTKTESKENLIDEMMKIDNALPAIKKDPFKAKDTAEVAAAERSMKEKKSEKNKDKSKKKKQITKALIDLTKTTDASHDVLPSAQDSRYQEAKLKLKQGKKKNELSGDKNENDGLSANDKPKSIMKRTQVTTNILSSKTFEAEKQDYLLAQDTENIKYSVHDALSRRGASRTGISGESKSPQMTNTENEILPFTSDDSSTDGEDVEIIYQSKKAKDSDSARSPIGKEGNALGNTNDKKNIENERSLFLKSMTDNEKDLQHQSAFQRKESSVANVKVINSSPLVEKETVETKSTDLDGIEETDLELTDWQNDENEAQPKGTKAIVPPLKLNIGERLGKKAKRGLMRDNSKGKYLGTASLPKGKTTSKRP